jgi:hypothetical protein
MKMQTVLRIVAALLCIGTSMLAHATPALAMTVASSTVTISGVTPHGKVVFFGVARFVDRTTVIVRRLDRIVSDDDGDGVVAIDIGQSVPWKSVFAAVDFASGRYVLATPDASMFPLLPLPLGAAGLFKESEGTVKHIVVKHHICEILIVRPNVGAWGHIIAAGNKYDVTPEAGHATANVAASPALGPGIPPAPDHLEEGDVVVLIDRQRMQSWATAVGAN